MRAVVYLRISQDRAGEELGVDRQREKCLALAKARGWTVIKVFVDNDTSATSAKKRPQWELMMAEVEAGRVDVVIGTYLDRVLRKGRDRIRMLDAGREHGLIISLVKGSDMDLGTPSGRVTADVLGALAQSEIEFKSDRQMEANEQAAKQGRRVGGRKPFAFETDGLTVIHAEAEALRDGYQDLLSEVPLAAIAASWNKLGFRTGQKPHRRAAPPDGGNSIWRHDSVRRVLLNPRYAGIRVYKGEERGEAVWPAIVPLETFRAAQAVLADPTRHNGGAGPMGIQLLTGHALCGNAECELPVHGGGASHKKPIYRCSADSDKTVKKAPGRHPNRLAGPIDHYVTDVVLARLAREDAAELLTDSARPDVPALRTEADRIRTRLDQLAAEFATQKEVSMSEYRSMTRTLRDRLSEIGKEITDAGKVDLLGDLVRAEDAAEVWGGLDIHRQRAIIRELVDVRILTVGHGVRTFRPESVLIQWKIDDAD